MFFFCIKNVLISQYLLQHPFCNFFNPKMYLDKSKIPFLLCIQLTISLRIGKQYSANKIDRLHFLFLFLYLFLLGHYSELEHGTQQLPNTEYLQSEITMPRAQKEQQGRATSSEDVCHISASHPRHFFLLICSASHFCLGNNIILIQANTFIRLSNFSFKYCQIKYFSYLGNNTLLLQIIILSGSRQIHSSDQTNFSFKYLLD